MVSRSVVSEEDFVSNPTARVPVCLCLDISGSMAGDPIKELNSGVKLFYDSIQEDDMARFSAEICIVTFGGDNVAECIRDFSTLSENEEPPVLYAIGRTPLGEAVNMALDLLDNRKKDFKSSGIDYYQPWLVLMTDGAPNGAKDELDEATKRVQDLVKKKKLVVFPIGIGSEADKKSLSKLSPDREPLKLIGLNFREFFTWLSKSVGTTSRSTPGDVVEIDFASIRGWGTLFN